MHLAEHAGQHAVAAHGEQQARGGDLGVHDVGDADGHDVDHQHEVLQQQAAGGVASIEEAHIGIGVRPVGQNEGGHVGLGHEHDDHDAQRDEDALADVLLGTMGLLSQGGHAVEAEEGQAGQGDGRCHEVEVHLTGLVERLGGELTVAAAAGDVHAAHGDEHDERHDLHGEDDPVHTLRHGDAAHVHVGVEGDEHQHPQPPGRAGHERGAPVGHHDQQKRGNQDVVQQNEPAGHEAHVGVDGALHIGVHRAGDGKLVGHRRVAQGREADGDKADDVHERRQAAGIDLQRAPDGLRRDEHHEQNAVENDVVELQPAAQLLLVAEGLDVLTETDGWLLDGFRHELSPFLPFQIPLSPTGRPLPSPRHGPTDLPLRPKARR